MVNLSKILPTLINIMFVHDKLSEFCKIMLDKTDIQWSTEVGH